MKYTGNKIGNHQAREKGCFELLASSEKTELLKKFQRKGKFSHHGKYLTIELPKSKNGKYKRRKLGTFYDEFIKCNEKLSTRKERKLYGTALSSDDEPLSNIRRRRGKVNISSRTTDAEDSKNCKEMTMLKNQVRDLQEKLEQQRQDDEIVMKVFPTTDIDAVQPDSETISDMSSDSGSYLFSKIDRHDRNAEGVIVYNCVGSVSGETWCDENRAKVNVGRSTFYAYAKKIR